MRIAFVQVYPILWETIKKRVAKKTKCSEDVFKVAYFSSLIKSTNL